MNAVRMGATIAKLRRARGFTQLKLAEMLNVSTKTVSKWECGGGYPEITMIPVLCEIFGVSADYLLRGDTEGIAIAGNLIADIVNIIDRYPEKLMLATVYSLERAVGGCVPNTLIDIAKMDSDIYLKAIGRVGNDENGRFIISELNKHGIDTGGLQIDNKLPTASCSVMSEKSGGARTFFSFCGANAKFGIEDVDVDNLECKLFHLGYILLLEGLDEPDPVYGTKAARLLDIVSRKGIKTSIDAVSEEGCRLGETVKPALPYCDYVILNEIETCQIAGVSPHTDDGEMNFANIKKAMGTLISLGVREKVIVHCTAAGMIMNRDGSFELVPSLDIPAEQIKGSVGAGDAFAAGCLYGLYKGFGDRQILEYASAAAACNLFASDSVSGMKKRDEIEKMDTMYQRRKLEI